MILIDIVDLFYVDTCLHILFNGCIFFSVCLIIIHAFLFLVLSYPCFVFLVVRSRGVFGAWISWLWGEGKDTGKE